MRQQEAHSVRRTAASRLAAFYRRNGYCRLQNRRRLAEEGPQSYKKGDEVRLVANSVEELAQMRRLLNQEGFRPGQPFVKGQQFRLPIYGRRQVARFLDMVEAAVDV